VAEKNVAEKNMAEKNVAEKNVAERKEGNIMSKKSPKRSRKKKVIIASGEEVVDVNADTSPSPGTTGAIEAPREAEEAEKAKEEKVEAKPIEASEAVLAATFAMAQAASQSGEQALALGDQISREILIQTIAFQLPRDWITQEVNERLLKFETEGLSLVLTWLALNWWAGYEIGRNDTIDALKKAAAKGMGGTPEGKAALATVENEIKEDRERVAREEGNQQS